MTTAMRMNQSRLSRMHLTITAANTNAAESFNALINFLNVQKSYVVSDDIQVCFGVCGCHRRSSVSRFVRQILIILASKAPADYGIRHGILNSQSVEHDCLRRHLTVSMCLYLRIALLF